MDRKSLAGITLATALLVAPTTKAGEKDDVEAVLKEIRDHKVEKIAEQEKARKEAEVQRLKYMEQHKERDGVHMIQGAGPGGIVIPGQPLNPWGGGEDRKNPK